MKRRSGICLDRTTITDAWKRSNSAVEISLIAVADDNEIQAIATESTQALSATCIVIAHRLSAIMKADRIVVLSAGRIIQAGPPNELLNDKEGKFHQLVHRQINETTTTEIHHQ